ncbi:hypothetical protein K9M41_01215 [Candidatus Gracilibacteria bacterium]|nr:hypothetical protein [Candidatus Gracilibacteria bacterium]
MSYKTKTSQEFLTDTESNKKKKISGFFQLNSKKQDLRNLSIKNKTFENFIIQGADLTGDSFLKCEFNNTIFIDCCLVCTTFSDCLFTKCTIINGQQDYTIKKSNIGYLSEIKIGDYNMIKKYINRII